MSAAPAIDTEELLTIEEFGMLHFDEVADLIEGKVFLMGNNNPDHGIVQFNVSAAFKPYLRERKLGQVFAGDVKVLTRRGPDTGRGIDLAFVSNETLKDQPDGVAALHVAPELGVEIMSPSNPLESVLTKLAEYFDIGMKEVWVISLAVRSVMVYNNPLDSKGYTLAKGESLRIPEILPDFELPLAEIFEGLPDLTESEST